MPTAEAPHLDSRISEASYYDQGHGGREPLADTSMSSAMNDILQARRAMEYIRPNPDELSPAELSDLDALYAPLRGPHPAETENAPKPDEFAELSLEELEQINDLNRVFRAPVSADIELEPVETITAEQQELPVQEQPSWRLTKEQKAHSKERLAEVRKSLRKSAWSIPQSKD